ncbi:hypothetical protein E4U55_000463 [Claviceps digitariae]|nr:hypothetical protein E4U55_000463 [Claviceps digitariae]
MLKAAYLAVNPAQVATMRSDIQGLPFSAKGALFIIRRKCNIAELQAIESMEKLRDLVTSSRTKMLDASMPNHLR